MRRDRFRRGDSAIWLAGSGLGLCLLMITGMIGLILTRGLGFFWPAPLERVTLTDGTVLMGEIAARELVPGSQSASATGSYRIQMKLGNRDLTGADFRWVDEAEITARTRPAEAIYVERREYGPFIGEVAAVREDDRVVATGAAAWDSVRRLARQAASDRAAIRDLERHDLGDVNTRLEAARLRARSLDTEAGLDAAERARRQAALTQEIAELQAAYDAVEARLSAQMQAAARATVTFRAADGTEKDVAALDLFRVYAANQLGPIGRARIYASRVWEFLSAEPRESNTEGGIFPAIFGTVMMVLLMSLMAVPFGVLTAVYLREYARQGLFVRLVRIAVNNLAGVPSIVFGVFGLGFFVYTVGGAIDQAFYADRLPTPTFGTGGILWASLTLALLTVPVVIVAAEEALAAVPRSMREASLAAGATTFQTLLRVVLPAAAPGILTGLILAMARGAGEVAPLMITGVVKLAPDMPFDGTFPFLHLERKFMHLGFHIFDVGFQSPNVEAAKPMVYATSLLLLAIVIALNLTAILVRNRLRRKYQVSAF